MSVGPIRPQEVEKHHYVPIPDEVCIAINEALIKWWDIKGREARLLCRDIKEAAYLRVSNDRAGRRRLSKFFGCDDWIARVIIIYENVGWRVKHDYIVADVSRLVFRKV